MPWTTADEIAADNEKVIYIPDSDISGTAAELAKIKSLVLVGGYSFTDEDESFFCDPVLDDTLIDDADWSTIEYDKILFGYKGHFYTARRGNITDISFLEYFPNLESLIISGNKVTDISPIFQLKNLQNLGLEFNYITSIEGISALENLIDVKLGYNKFTDTADLFDCPMLCGVDLQGTPLTELGTDDLSRIGTLDIFSTDISYVPKMGVGLEGVCLVANASNVTDYSFLSEAKSFGCIYATGSVKETLLPVIKGKPIDSLNWDRSDILSLTELDGLEFFPEGSGKLELITCDIEDLHGAENIKGLKTIGLFSDLKLKSLDGLEACESLEIVGVY